MDLEALKDKAAAEALELVEPGMKLGLGTGSTVAWFLKHLAAALAEGRLRDVAGVPTSEQTARICRETRIPLLDLAEHPDLDLGVDGADDVDPSLDLIKGLGGALLREKMVARATRRFIVIADATKIVDRLGTRSPLPVEVVQFAWESHLPFLSELGADPTLRRTADGAPFVTDNGNYVLDCRFDGGIAEAGAVERALADRPGIVDHGLFMGLCERAFIAAPEGVRVLERP